MTSEVFIQEEHHKILLVDDTPANIQMLNEILQGDYPIFFATNEADKALYRAKENDGNRVDAMGDDIWEKLSS